MRMTSKFVQLGEFDTSHDDWKSYSKRLDVADVQKKRSVLLGSWPFSYKLIRNLCSPNSPIDKMYKEIIKLISNYCPTPSMVVESLKFQLVSFHFHSAIDVFFLNHPLRRWKS